jgi:hypothetical protein
MGGIACVYRTLFYSHSIVLMSQTFSALNQCFSTFVKPRTRNFFFFKDEGTVPTNLIVNTFTIFLSSYIKLTQVFIINYGIIIKSIITLTYMLWHVDKYKITFKLVTSPWTNEMSFSTHSRILFSSEYFHYKLFIHEICLDNRLRQNEVISQPVLQTVAYRE